MDHPRRSRHTLPVARWLTPVLFALLGLLCGCPQPVRALEDASVTDAGTVVDTGVSDDAGPFADSEVRVDAGSPGDAGADPDAQTPADAGSVDAQPPRDAGPTNDAGPAMDAGFVPNPPCEAAILECLDPTLPEVLSVPDEMTWTDAKELVQANQTIQIRGLNVGAGIRVPPAVTLHGCEGAAIVGAIAFSGLGGRVQGFEVTGSIVANQTGAYVVRKNRFISTASGEAGVSGRSVDALVSARVTLIVEQNSFVGRSVAAATRYDTMQHEVSIQVRNNTFASCDTCITVDEAGLVGQIDATIEHNTFYGFSNAVALYGLALPTPLNANLFVDGTRAVSGNSQFTVQYALLDGVTTASQLPPFSGAFAQGSAGLVDPSQGDFRLSINSDALDLVPAGVATVSEDFAGCPRPVAYRQGTALGDLGAFEAQP